MQKISIFMSPLDVHVNRSPAAGVVKNKVYQKGSFRAAFAGKSSQDNEQAAIHLQTDQGFDIVFVQIAGWLARRIVCYPEVNARLQCGAIFGMIKFGSRMDIYLPENCLIEVVLHQTVKAGQSILARTTQRIRA
jgi:phosphatidylserine decarboxylase